MVDKSEILKELGKAAIKGVKKVGPYILAAELYTKIFYHRINSDPLHRFEQADYPLLLHQKKIFYSEKTKLVGYLYHYKEYDPSKLIVFAHGYGNGHKRYLDLINGLCERGLMVFAYDLTGFDESEGKGIRSFPQAIIDLNNALTYIRRIFKKQDLCLVGHSMGGYAVGCNLSLNKDIKKAVILSGFNKSSELVKAHGEEWVGKDAENVIKYIDTYEDAFFGKYAKMTVLDGLKNTNAECMIIHSRDDKTVPYESSFALYHAQHKGDKRFEFISFKDRGHGTIYSSTDGKKYYEYVASEFNKFKKNNPKATDEEKEAYFNTIIDKSLWLNMVNNTLLDRIADFIKE